MPLVFPEVNPALIRNSQFALNFPSISSRASERSKELPIFAFFFSS